MKKLKLLLATLVCIGLTSCTKKQKIVICTFEGSECSDCIPYNEDIIKVFNCKDGTWKTKCIDKEKGHYHIEIELYGD